MFTKQRIHSLILPSAFIVAGIIIFVANLLASTATPVYAYATLQGEDGNGCYQYAEGMFEPSQCSGTYIYDSTGTTDCAINGGECGVLSGYCYTTDCSGGEDGGGGGGGEAAQCSPYQNQCGLTTIDGLQCAGSTCNAGCAGYGTPQCTVPTVVYCPDGVTPKIDIDGDGILDDASCCPAGKHWDSGQNQCIFDACDAPTQDTQTLSCPAGQAGSIEQTRTKSDAPECAWGGWTTTSNTCAPIPPPDQSCNPPSDTSTSACPGGQTGQITWQTNYENYPTCSPSEPFQVSDTCACPQGQTWDGTQCVEPTTTASIHVTTNNASATWTISPGNLAGSGQSGNYTVTPAQGGSTYTITPGNISGYTPVVTNSDGGGSMMQLSGGGNKSFTINYSNGVTSDFSLTNGGNKTVEKSGSNVFVTNTITRTPVSGTQVPVGIAITSDLPNGVSASISAPNPCTASCSSTITFTIAPNADIGVFTVIVTGSGTGTPTHTTSFGLTINPASGFTVSCAASPSPSLVGQAVTWTANVSGGTAPYTYSWSGTNFPETPPSGNPFSITYQTTGSKTTQVTVRDHGGTGATAQCQQTQLQVNVNPQFREF